MKQKLRNFLTPKLQYFRYFDYNILYNIFKIISKKDNSKNVLFLSDSRNTISGNFKFVYDYIKKNNNYNINFILKNNLKEKRKLKDKIKLCKALSVSKYIFLDDFYPLIYPLKFKKDVKLIQLWHAMGAYKKVGYSRLGKPGGPSKKSLTHKNYTDTIVSSENIRKNYSEAFGITIDKVHPLGIPRTDIFFDKDYKTNIRAKLYNKYPKLKNKKVILFAPTFRGNGQKDAHYNYNWLDFNKIKKEFKDKYIFVFKMHPFIKNKPNIDLNDKFFLNLSKEREINDLLFITDILITDYSSVIFEYSFFKKPIIYFMPDLKEYKNSRDFYYNIDKYIYGPIAKNNLELINEIKENKINKNKIEDFYNFFCSSCDGNSTERVCKYIFKR